MFLTQQHNYGVDETCKHFVDRRMWQNSFVLVVTKANVERYVPSGRFHASQMPAKANGPGSVRVMLKTRLMGVALFAFRAGFGADPFFFQAEDGIRDA